MLKIKSFAKINLGLEVLYKRNDGFHEINTIFAKIGLFDEIIIEPSKELIVECMPQLNIHQDQNLAYKSSKLIQNFFACKSKAAKITIFKKIPIGGGLGGGSSNAAYVMLGLNKFWGINAPNIELQKLSSSLGADVPFFIGGNFAVGKGKGDILEYFNFSLPYHILLAFPKIKINTAWAYSLFKKPDNNVSGENLKNIIIQNINNPEILRNKLKNDFEELIFEIHSELRYIKDNIYKNGADFCQMSGSGSCIYGLFKDLEVLLEAKKHLDQLCPSIIINQEDMPKSA